MTTWVAKIERLPPLAMPKGALATDHLLRNHTDASLVKTLVHTSD